MKVLVKSNNARGRATVSDRGHAIQLYLEYRLFDAAEALFKANKCPGELPEMKYDRPPVPDNYDVPSYVTDALAAAGVNSYGPQWKSLGDGFA